MFFFFSISFYWQCIAIFSHKHTTNILEILSTSFILIYCFNFDILHNHQTIFALRLYILKYFFHFSSKDIWNEIPNGNYHFLHSPILITTLSLHFFGYVFIQIYHSTVIYDYSLLWAWKGKTFFFQFLF